MKNLFYKQINAKLYCLVRKFLILLCLLGFSNVILASSLFDMQLRNFSIKNVTLKKAIEYLLKDSNYNLTYSLSDINSYKNISFTIDNETVENALKTVLTDNGLTYSVRDNNIIISKAPIAQTPVVKITIAGKVVDDVKKPIAGATILVKGTTNGAISDEKGNFAVTLNKGEEIEVSFVGMVTFTKKIEAADPNMVIQMKMDAMAVEDVVVTGYFTKNKESYTGAVTTFTGKELRSVSTGSLLNSLAMLDPSFTKLDNNLMGSNPNAVPNFEIRGAGNIKSEFEGSSNMPTFIMDGFEVSATKVFDMDPNRIKSITILKDAAATAIYGSRAANGVVVLETTEPVGGRLLVSYNGSANFEMPDLSAYNLMNSAEKVEYERLAGLFSQGGSNPEDVDKNLQTYNDRLKLVAMGYDTKWINIPLKELGVGHKHNLNVEGGDNVFRYSVGAYYSNTAGVVKRSDRSSYGGSVTLRYNMKKFKLSNYTSYDHVIAKNSPFGDFSRYGYANPYYYPYKKDGSIEKELYTYRYFDAGLHDEIVYNWLYDTTIPFKDQNTSDNFTNNLSLEYDVFDGFKIKGNLSLGVDHADSDVYRSKDAIEFAKKEKESSSNEDSSSKAGSYSKSFTKGFSYDINVVLTYFKQFGKNALNVGAVYNARETNSDNTSIFVQGFPNANMDHVSMGAGYVEGAKPSANYTITRLLGFMGNVGYAYDDKYLFDASIRSDASSIFGSNNRWSTFWSIGIGWNLHKEKFLQDSKVINLLKVRASIGTTGGQNFSPYQSMAMFAYNASSIKDVVYDSKIGALLMAFGNENLKWQVTNKRNIGLDFELLDRRLTGSFNYYNDESTDALIDVTLPPSTGFSSYAENLGSISNTGFDLSLRGTLIRNYSSDFRWNVSLNIVHNKNKLMKINNALTTFNNSQDGKSTDKPVVRYQEGLSMNTIWANESMGIDPATGNELFIGMDGKMTDKWKASNYKPLGNRDSKLYGNFGTTLYYKGLEFNATFYYKYGGQNYNETLVNKIENVNPNENGDKRILYDRWKQPGDIAKYKRIADVSKTEPTSRFIEDENYIQLQSVSLAYQFGTDALKKMGIERLRVAAIGNDIFTASTIKMERGIQYPFARTVSISLQLTF